MTNLFGPMKLRYAVLCLIISVAAAVAAYLIGQHAVKATYQASGTIRVVLPAEGAISDPSVTAANDLATQYSQLVSSPIVETLTAKALKVPVASLNGQLSGSTLAAQNLIQVTASGASAGEAASRAAAAVKSVASYFNSLSNQTSLNFLRSVRSGLLAEIPIPPSTPRAPNAFTIPARTAHAQTLGQGVLDAAASPAFQIIDGSPSAGETSPKPKLYALIALVVALLVTFRLAFMMARPVGEAPAAQPTPEARATYAVEEPPPGPEESPEPEETPAPEQTSLHEALSGWRGRRKASAPEE